ncbi:IS21 family transposase [Alkalicella caledoniensis]|uniref:IS21 family transposase n=1 Tax=Alkalicella caledoniensis TaxID=2731377 RepID=A0A7G9W3P3_ALKCA|nr:IS21 family transposase [Alkalicella caledoniensis]QNO13305.1 IS21 family transposase [Alkalicella caledoniensis]
MKIEVDIYKEIRMGALRGESQRSIAKRLGISRPTVKKYYDGSSHPESRKSYERDPDIVTDEVKSFILECFDLDKRENVKKQKHTAKKIYDRLVKEKGFTGGESTIRKAVKALREEQKVPPQSNVPLSYEPGEAVQIDWGEATVYLSNEKTKLYTFCARLCYSCDIFVQVFKSANEESFLEAQQRMFDFFGGIPVRLIFDNAKVAVKEGFGIYAKPQKRYLSFSAHYAFNLDFCNPAKGNEKGLVENLVGYSRRNFLVPIPRTSNIEELNQRLWDDCLKYREKHHIAGRVHSVKTMYTEELPYLSSIPSFRFDTSKSIVATVDDYSTVRYEKNYYSVPTKYLRKEVTVKGYGNTIRVIYQNTEIAAHSRAYHSGHTQYQLEHYIDLIEKKPRSVFNAKPVKQNVTSELLKWGKELPGGNREMVKLLRLCLDYGEEYILDLKRSIPSTTAPSVDMIRTYLNKPVNVPTIKMSKEVPVEPVDLNQYDKKYGMVVH